MVECTGLENQRAERYRGFESLPLRHESNPFSYGSNIIDSALIDVRPCHADQPKNKTHLPIYVAGHVQILPYRPLHHDSSC